MTGLVGRLERKGLLRRTADPEDRRTRRLVLTEQGTDALAAIEPARRTLNARIADVLGDDANRFVAALSRLATVPEDGA